MKFKYKVISEEMKITEGELDAVDLEAAKRMILDNRWQLIEIKEVKGLMTWLNKEIKPKVKYESVSAFCSQLAMMIRSGANLVRGLEILQSQIDDRRLKEVIEIIFRGVSRGDSLAQAMRETRGALPELLVNLVAVGEQSGMLDTVLVSMAQYYERENFIRKKITSAAIYPVIMLVVLVGLVAFFMGFILPEIMDLIKQNGQALPPITQFIVDSSTFVNTKGWMLLVIIGLIVVLAHRLIKIPKYRYILDAFILRIPLLGKNTRNVVIARFSRTLALFLHASIPIVPILNSLESIVGNEVPRHAIVRSRERVIQGETLAQAFGQEEFFDPLVVQMMSIGEETGRLEELMGEVANNYDKRVEIGIARMVALVEPIFTIIIGIFAGGMIISIALPIFNMASGMK